MIKKFKIKTNYKGREYKYNRTYVKKSQSNFIPFSKGSYVSKWEDDYWHKNKKIDNYLKRFFIKNVGKNIDEVLDKFSKLNFRDAKEMYSKWNEYVKEKHVYIQDIEKWGRFVGFYVDENNILCYNKRNKHNSSDEYVRFTYEQLNWNETRNIPIFGKVREEPRGDLIGIAKKYRYVNDFYVSYKDCVIKLPVYHVSYGERLSFKSNRIGTHDYYHNKNYKENFRSILIPVKKGFLKISSNWYDYYPGKEKIINDDGSYEYVKKDIIGNLGYGLLNFHIMVGQAEKEYEKILIRNSL